MFGKLVPLFVILCCGNLNYHYVGAYFEYCDHPYTLNAYGRAYINSPYYSTVYTPSTCQYPSRLPCRYPPGSSCRYQIIAPPDFNIYVQCNISLDNFGSNCNTEYFYVSTDGDKSLRSSEYFCGNGYFQRQSLFSELTLAYTSDSTNNNGWFTCYVEAVPSNLQPNCNCGWSMTSKITGGEEAKINEFPSMAAIVDSTEDLYKPFCGSTIIHSKWCVTAAHCFDKYRPSPSSSWNPQQLRLLVGEHDLKTAAESPFTELYTVNNVIIHNLYRVESTDYDIALIRTFLNMRWSRGVGPACLPFNWVGYTFTGTPVDMVGWGTLGFAGARSTKLQKVTVNVAPDNECTNTYGAIYDSRKQICTKGIEKDSCQYDSGGPVFWRNGRNFLLGVISFGKPCGTSQAAVNTRITEYLSWIEYQTQERYCKVYN